MANAHYYALICRRYYWQFPECSLFHKQTVDGWCIIHPSSAIKGKISQNVHRAVQKLGAKTATDWRQYIFLTAHNSHSQWHYLWRNVYSYISPVDFCVRRDFSSITVKSVSLNTVLRLKKTPILIQHSWNSYVLIPCGAWNNTWKNTSLYDKSTELSCLDSPSQNTPNPMEHKRNSKSSSGMMLFGPKYYL